MKINAVVQSILVAIVLTGISYGVGFAFGWIDQISWLETFAVFTSYACTYLCVKEKRINYPIGAISSAAYCVLFFQQDLLASTAINALLVGSLVYGWFRWRSDANARPVTHLQPKWGIVYLLATAAVYGLVVLTVSLLGGQLATWDAVILVGTILAQLLLDNKKIETWFVWVIVNVAAIYVYFTAGLTLAGFQYIFFLANTVYGFVEWRKSMNKVVTPAQATSAESYRRKAGLDRSFAERRADSKERSKGPALTLPLDKTAEENDLDIWKTFGFTNVGEK